MGGGRCGESHAFLLLKRYLKYLKNPSKIYMHALNKYGVDYLWNKYSRKCRKLDLCKPGFILSFDCDTDFDIAVVGAVHQRLNAMGIMPVYAVPGELLLRGHAVYKKIYASGASFLNHGYLQHTEFNGTTYNSTIFYDKLSNEEIKQDIYRGHETIKQVLGFSPCGFRTPHFGSYTTKRNLKFLYAIINELGYQFSSSTTPYFSFKYGMGYKKEGIIEFPLTGCPDYPLTLLDSWGFRCAPNRNFTPEDFIAQIAKMKTWFHLRKPLLANIYVDPSQVYDWDAFFNALESIAEYNIPSYEVVKKMT